MVNGRAGEGHDHLPGFEPLSLEGGRLRLITAGASVDPEEFARAVRRGLTAGAKRLPCRYFYDEEGSALFEAICDLSEYYLTRAEREILAVRAGEIATLFEGDVTLAELGSGSSVKTRLLLGPLMASGRAVRYVPVDISRSMLESSARTLLEEYATLEIVALAGEYGDGLEVIAAQSDRPRLVLWLGSNIGNLPRAEAAAFLRAVTRTFGPADRLLVGIDLRKDAAVLEAAYDDAEGITARFNLNLLARINRELGGGFDLDQFRHRATYDEAEGRIEMYLVSRRKQAVWIEALNVTIDLSRDEAIHTEDSYKYSRAEIEELAHGAGLRLDRHWCDAQNRFSVNLLAPSGEPAAAERLGHSESGPS